MALTEKTLYRGPRSARDLKPVSELTTLEGAPMKTWTVEEMQALPIGPFSEEKYEISELERARGWIEHRGRGGVHYRVSPLPPGITRVKIGGLTVLVMKDPALPAGEAWFSAGPKPEQNVRVTGLVPNPEKGQRP